MFKKLISNKGKEWFGTDKPQTPGETQQNKSDKSPAQSFSLSVNQKPFKVNLNELWQYDYEELSDFIHQYEDYLTFFRGKYNELLNKCQALEAELAQFKQGKENSPGHTDSITPQRFGDLLGEFTAASSTTGTLTKEKLEAEWKHIEEMVNSKIKMNYIDEKLITGLQDTANSLVTQLSGLQNDLLASIAQQPFSSGHEDGMVDLLGGDDFTSSQKDDNRFVSLSVKEGWKDELMNLIGDIEMTAQLVFPKLLTINDKIKTQEKTIVKEILSAVGGIVKPIMESQGEVAGSEFSKITEGEVGELKAQIESLKVRLSEKESSSLLELGQLQGTEGNGEGESSALAQRIRELEIKGKEEEARTKKVEAALRDSENKKQEMEKKLKQMELNGRELGEKIKELERVKKEAEKQGKDFENRFKEFENKMKEAEAKEKVLEGKLKEMQMKRREAESQKEEITNQMEWLRKEYQNLISTSEKTEGETGGEIIRLQEKIEQLEKEKEKLKERTHEAELGKVDMENKFIQERLKHHQVISDVQKLNETVKEKENSLNEEMENHKKVVERNESLKKKLSEGEKRISENKRLIKKLSQQILDLHEKLNKTKGEQEKEEEKVEAGENVNRALMFEEIKSPVSFDGSIGKEDFSISESMKVKELQHKLEEASKETSALKQSIQQLKEDKQTLSSQVKVLQEKRETGLQEILRLNAAIDKIKSDHPEFSFSIVQPMIPSEFSENSFSRSIQSPSTIVIGDLSPLGLGGESPIVKVQSKPEKITSPITLPGRSQISNMKKNLDQLYKEVILILTSEKFMKKDENNKEDDEVNQGLLKIEKKVNDTILILNDYTEALAKFQGMRS